MAYNITDKTNTTPPNGTYPFGNIKDDTGANDGTPVDVKTYADFHQFFAKLANLAGITLNGLPDNATNGFQLISALQALINIYVSAEAGFRASADTALQNNINGKVSKSGDTMGGTLNMGFNQITNVNSPINSGDATNKIYVDTQIATEASSRSSAVSGEASARSSADTALQNNINLKADKANPVITGTINKDGASLPVCVWIGRIDVGGGAGITFQAGISGVTWSDNTTADGILTHNLGTSNYVVQVTSVAGNSDGVAVKTQTTNSINIQNPTAAGRNAVHVSIFKL